MAASAASRTGADASRTRGRRAGLAGGAALPPSWRLARRGSLCSAPRAWPAEPADRSSLGGGAFSRTFPPSNTRAASVARGSRAGAATARGARIPSSTGRVRWGRTARRRWPGGTVAGAPARRMGCLALPCTDAQSPWKESGAPQAPGAPRGRDAWRGARVSSPEPCSTGTSGLAPCGRSRRARRRCRNRSMRGGRRLTVCRGGRPGDVARSGRWCPQRDRLTVAVVECLTGAAWSASGKTARRSRSV